MALGADEVPGDRRGKPHAAGDEMTPDQLLPQVYDELRKLAAAKLASEQPMEHGPIT